MSNRSQETLAQFVQDLRAFFWDIVDVGQFLVRKWWGLAGLTFGLADIALLVFRVDVTNYLWCIIPINIWMIAAFFVAAFQVWREERTAPEPPPEDAPDLAPLEPRLGDVPAPPDLLVGRDEMKAAIHADLDAGRRVSLHGMGGIGKTALAAAVACEWKTRGDTVLWAEAEYLAPEALCDEIGRRLGDREIVPLSGKEKADRLRWLLGKNAVQLLVLDNVWNAEAAREIEGALPGGCTLMVTGRERVGIGRAHDVEALGETDSATLLRYHANWDANTDARAVCELLGGHPMALRIAGCMASIKTLSPEAVRTELTKASGRVRALMLSEKATENVWVALSSSYETLDEDEQATFVAFGALWATTATVELMAPIAQLDEPATEAALNGLVAHSLTRREATPDGVTRYRAHDLTRDFALALLRDRAELPDAQARALAACVAYAQRYAERDRPAHDRLDAELDNLLAAAEYAAAREEWESVNRLAWDLVGNSQFLDHRGYAREATRLLARGVDAARALKNRRDEGAQLGNLGLAYADLGRVEEAIAYYEQALAISREIGDRRAEGAILGNLGLAYADLGRVEAAIGYYEQALLISREIGDRRGEGNRLGNLGLAYADLGRVEEAITYYEQALAIAREIGDRRGEASDLGNLGVAYADLGRVEAAIGYYEQALLISREIGDRRGEGNHLGNLGSAYRNLGRVEEAITYYEQALAIRREIGDRRGEGNALGGLGLAYAALGRVDDAITHYEQALAISREIGDPRIEVGCLCGLGSIRQAHEPEVALETMMKALNIARQIGSLGQEAGILTMMGLVYLDLGDIEQASANYMQGLEIAQKQGFRYVEALALIGLAGVYEEQGQFAKAIELDEQAKVIFEKEVKHPWATAIGNWINMNQGRATR